MVKVLFISYKCLHWMSPAYLSNLLTCSNFYWLLVAKKVIPPTCIQKWTEYFPNFNNADIFIWHRIIKLYFSVTRETRLQTFPYLLIHRSYLAANSFGVKSVGNVCNAVDHLMHFFIYCENTKQFCTSFYKWWNNISELGQMISLKNVQCTLFGYTGEEDIIQIL